jgi:hypothetical protein
LNAADQHHCVLEAGAHLLQLLEVGLRRHDVAAARGAHGTREVRDGLRGRIRRAERLELRGALSLRPFI